jgi:hypothetical protein
MKVPVHIGDGGVVLLASIAAVVFTGDLFLSASFGTFENPHLTLFHRLLPLWRILVYIPGVAIGLRVQRGPWRISAIAYSIGTVINYYRFDGYGIAREVPMPWLMYFRVMFVNAVAAALVGVAVALIGQFLRYLTNRWFGHARGSGEMAGRRNKATE